MFASLAEAELEEIRDEMCKFASGQEEAGRQLDVSEVSKNLKARAFHLADDPEAQRVLESIFGGVKKAARRSEFDDKSSRTVCQWQHLADEFFNSELWRPQNEFYDARLVDIDPSQAPSEPFLAEQLRKLFSTMRSQYSIFNDRYHRSGQLEEGDGDGDDDFYENFSGRDTVYLYAHKMFKGSHRSPLYMRRVTLICTLLVF